MPDSIAIEGIDEVTKFLQEAPALVVANGFLKALNAAARPIEIELAVRTPIGPISAEIENRLAESQVTETVLDSQLRGGFTEVGFGKQSNVANWVEFGHRMVTHKPGKKEVGSVPAHPFIRPAFEASAEAAVDAFAESLSETIRETLGGTE